MFKKPNKQELLTSIFILLWIFLINIVTPIFTPWPAWPMFFVTIFFFTLGGDAKQIPSIFLSGLAGIVSAFVLIKLLGILTPVMGATPATALLLFIVLAMIIVGGNFVPSIFNNTAFAYLTVCAIDLSRIEDHFTGWVVMHVFGGGIILFGALGIFVIIDKLSRKAEKA